MLHHKATILFGYGGHFESKMNAKIQNPLIWAKFGFQVDYDVANWYPNFTGMLSTMSRCADYFRNFQNGHHCHGNGQNAKKLKNTKMIIAGYSPNRNWWNLIGTTSTSSGTR